MDEEEKQELQRLIEEEKAQKKEQNASSNAWKKTPEGKAAQKRWTQNWQQNATEEQKAARSTYFTEWSRRNRSKLNAEGTARRLRKQEETAARPKPDTCEVCGNEGKIVFDHCHSSNRFRGWLCYACNTALGLLNDDPERLEKLTAYLRKEEPDDA